MANGNAYIIGKTTTTFLGASINSPFTLQPTHLPFPSSASLRGVNGLSRR